MSKDIRSFFKPKVNTTTILNSSKTSSFVTATSKPASSKLNGKRKVIISSDEDEDIQSSSTATSTISKKRSSPRKQQSSHPTINKKRRIIDSDDEEYNFKKTTQLTSGTTVKKPNLNKLKESQKLERKIVDVSTVFGKEPILHVARPKAVVQNQTLSENERESYFKDDFDVIDLIDTKLKDNNITISSNIQNVEDKIKIEKKQTPKKKVQTPTKEVQTPKKKVQTPTKEVQTPKKKVQTPTKEVQTQKKKLQTPTKEVQTPKKKVQTPTKEVQAPKKEIQTPKKKIQTPKKDVRSPKIKHESHDQRSPKVQHESQNLQPGNVSFADDARKKQIAAILYQKYKNRSGPLNPGSKQIPDGKPNCFAGLTFVLTGILESLDRDEITSIITKYGGKITTAISKKTKYVIVGEDAGPKKLATAIENGIPTLSEDDFLNLIRDKSSLCNSTTTKSIITPEKSTKIKAEKYKKIKAEKVDVIVTDVKDEHSDNMATKLEKRKLEINKNKSIKNEIVIPKKIIKIENNETKVPTDKGTTTAAITDNNENNKTWVDKYKPANTKQIIGQQGAASNCVKLTNWLKNWYSNHDGKKKLPKPTPWSKVDDGGYYKAALLSGPPGVGKTTTASLVCQELGFDTIEFNASDTRSKKLLKDDVAKILSNKTLHGYFTGDNGGKITKKHALIMDEVDGMAGNEDRGGIQELIALIKDSSIPIICMCNDHNHPKIRSLTNYCYDLRFSKPRLEQIKGAMLSICFKENIKIPLNVLEEIILSTNQDVRQTINNISLIYTKKDGPPSTTTSTTANTTADNNNNNNSNVKDAKLMKKDLRLGPWEVIRKVFSYEEHKTMSIYDKSDLFFHDYSLAPLFVQQNYLIVAPKVPKSEVLTQIALTADSLSIGDLVDKRIRTNMAWSMLPTQAMFSSVLPGEYMAGHFTGQINFPGWLGKNSKTNKRSRLAQELHDHTRIRTSASRLSIRLDYATILLNKILLPLQEKGVDGVQESLDVIKEYRLLREDIDSLIELTAWPGKKNIMDSIPGKVKAALTRAYNKEVSPYTYTVTTIKKKRGGGADDDNYDNDDYNVEDGENNNNNNNNSDDDDDDGNDNNVDNDVLIKSKKKTTTAQSSESSTSKNNVTSLNNKNDKIIAKKNKVKK